MVFSTIPHNIILRRLSGAGMGSVYKTEVIILRLVVALKSIF
jgi:hypothetical protein